MRVLLAALFCAVAVGVYSRSVAENDLRKLLNLLTERKKADKRQGSGEDISSTVPTNTPFPMPNTPVEHYTQPQSTDSYPPAPGNYYPETGSGQETGPSEFWKSNRWMDYTFESLEESFLFPGYDFMYNLMGRAEMGDWSGMDPTVSDKFKDIDLDLDKFPKRLHAMMEITHDPSVPAFWGTRRLLEVYFPQRFNCPSTIVDTIILSYTSQTSLTKFTSGEFFDWMKDRLRRLHPAFDNEYVIDDVTYTTTERLFQMVFKQTKFFIMGLGMGDVAIMMNDVYETIYRNFERPHVENFHTGSDEYLEEYIKNMFQVDFFCPDFTMVKMVHARAMERFRYQFEDMTNATMCSYMKQHMGKDIMEYIVNNYYGYYRKRGLEQNFENVNMDMAVFDDICGRVRMMVDGMLVNFMDIEKLFDGTTPREEIRQKFEPVVGNEKWWRMDQAMRILEGDWPSPDMSPIGT